MIDIELLKQVSVIYTHAHCPDGLASAMILKDAFRMLGMAPRIEFLAHGTPEHRRASFHAPGERALFCDIAPHPDVVDLSKEWDIVLDHHKGAEALVRSFGERGVFADEMTEPGVSGAVLAWREVWANVASWVDHAADRPIDHREWTLVEDFAGCVGLRDTWQTQDERFLRGQWISKALMSKPASYWLDHGRAYLTEREVDMGCALFEAHEEAVRQAVRQCVHYDVPDGNRLVELYVFQEQASGFRLCSDVAEALRANHPEGVRAVVAGFSYVVDKPGDEPRLVYSLRGLGGFDVCAFAKANGGGGHTAAAGFSTGVHAQGPNPYEYVRRILSEFLGTGGQE